MANGYEYQFWHAGYEAGLAGKGLSDCPWGGKHGDLWKSGLRNYLETSDSREESMRIDVRMRKGETLTQAFERYSKMQAARWGRIGGSAAGPNKSAAAKLREQRKREMRGNN